MDRRGTVREEMETEGGQQEGGEMGEGIINFNFLRRLFPLISTLQDASECETGSIGQQDHKERRPVLGLCRFSVMQVMLSENCYIQGNWME